MRSCLLDDNSSNPSRDENVLIVVQDIEEEPLQWELPEADQDSRLLVVKKMKCLIANDEDMQLAMLERLFHREHFDVMTARNGYEAL